MDLPIIDAHHHFWDPARGGHPRPSGAWEHLRGAFGPAELEPELKLHGMTGTVLVHTVPRIDETRDLLGIARSVPWVRGVIGWVDLTSRDVAADIEMLRAAPGGDLLVGLRHRLDDEPDPDWLRRDDVHRGLVAVETADLVFDLHARPRELPAAYDTCAALPGLRFVLEHLASPPIVSGDLSGWGRAVLPLADLPNVSAKISGLVTEADWHTWSIDELRDPVELAVDAFGAHRLMLASDWPVCLLAGSYSDVIDSVRYLLAELPTHMLDEIRGGTAVRTYRLRHPGG